MSEAIIGRIDELGSRIDDLEKSISDLMEEVRFFFHMRVDPELISGFDLVYNGASYSPSLLFYWFPITFSSYSFLQTCTRLIEQCPSICTRLVTYTQ